MISLYAMHVDVLLDDPYGGEAGPEGQDSEREQEDRKPRPDDADPSAKGKTKPDSQDESKNAPAAHPGASKNM